MEVLVAAGFPVLRTIKRDWMKEPRALTMSLNTLVECCFMSSAKPNALGQPGERRRADEGT